MTDLYEEAEEDDPFELDEELEDVEEWEETDDWESSVVGIVLGCKVVGVVKGVVDVAATGRMVGSIFSYSTIMDFLKCLTVQAGGL